MAIAIVAVDKNWGIGYQGQLLEHIPEDLKHFKDLTNHGIVIMGRNTWESLPKKETLPKLPNRLNIIVSNSIMGQIGQLTYAMSLEDSIRYIQTFNNTFVIGGGQIYKTLLPYCNQVYVTKIDKAYDNVDTFFPNLDESREWKWTRFSPMLSYNDINYQFCRYDRIN